MHFIHNIIVYLLTSFQYDHINIIPSNKRDKRSIRTFFLYSEFHSFYQLYEKKFVSYYQLYEYVYFLIDSHFYTKLNSYIEYFPVSSPTRKFSL